MGLSYVDDGQASLLLSYFRRFSLRHHFTLGAASPAAIYLISPQHTSPRRHIADFGHITFLSLREYCCLSTLRLGAAKYTYLNA